MARFCAPVSHLRTFPSIKLKSLFMACLTCIPLLLAACGTQGGTQKVTLQMLIHNNPATVAAMKEINKEFEQKHGIRVNMSVVETKDLPTAQQTRLSAKNVDIFELAAFTGAPTEWATTVDKPKWQQWIDANLFEDLTNEPFIKDYSPNALKDSSTYKGKVYALTAGSYITNGYFYNRELFQQNGLKAPTTWNEFVQACETLKKKGIIPITVGGKEGWTVSVAMNGLYSSLFPDLEGLAEGLWDGSFKYSDPQYKLLLERSQKIVSYFQEGFMGIDMNSAVARFANGQAAMLPAGSWDSANIAKANPAADFGFFPLPGSDNAADNTTYAGKYDISWALPSSSRYKAEALKWFDFYSEKQNYAKIVNATGILPAQPEVELSDPFLKEVAPQAASMKLDLGQVFPKPRGYANAKHAGCTPILLAPVGTVASIDELIPKCIADWDAVRQQA